MSKTTASQRLASLEGALGQPLFVRGARGMRPTGAGLLVVRFSRVVLHTLGELTHQLETMG